MSSATQNSASAVLTPTKTIKPPPPIYIDTPPPPTAKVPPAMNNDKGSSASHHSIQFTNCDNHTVNIGCTFNFHYNTVSGSDVSFAKSYNHHNYASIESLTLNFLSSLFRMHQTQTKERSVGLTPSLVTAYLHYYWY
jgi:hypothetical protein